MTTKPVGTIAEAIVIARDTLRHVPPDGSGRTSILPGLHAYAEKNFGLKVQIQKVAELDQRYLRGMIVRYPDRAIISISPDLNECWTRFVVCKELMHILVDTSTTSFTTDPVSQLAQIFMGGQSAASAQVHSEHYALVAALEYMLPKAHRPRDCNGAESVMKVAERFKMPRAYVDFFYGSFFRNISDDIT